MNAQSNGFVWFRRFMGVVGVVVGLSATSAVLDLMKHINTDKKTETAVKVVSFDVPSSSKPPPRSAAARPKQAATSRAAKAAPPPSAAFAPGLAGMDFGLPGLGGALDEATRSIVGDVSQTVMNEDAVDVPPRPSSRVQPDYPARARASAITGFVTLSLRVSNDGSVQDVRVLEAQPSGVFEAAAMDAIKQWRFEPAMYQGAPVAVRVRQTLRFELE